MNQNGPHTVYALACLVHENSLSREPEAAKAPRLLDGAAERALKPPVGAVINGR